MYGASCTMKNGKSPAPQPSRQLRIIVERSDRYCEARPELLSPWYQVAPLMA